MPTDEKHYLGYLKYSGKSVEEGVLDIRKSAEALLGFDEILRYFILKEDPSLKGSDFEIPVRIRKGSWEMLIPLISEHWKVMTCTGILAKPVVTYLNETAKHAAENGLFETAAVKDISNTIKSSIKAAQWVIKISKHLGAITKKKIENIRVEEIDSDSFVNIENDQGEVLLIPKKYFDLYEACPEKIFAKNANIIRSERELELGLFDDDKVEKVSIEVENRHIFAFDEDDENLEENDVVFPELKHGQKVDLVGEITRATESANTIGFRYEGHILVCRPHSGNIARFKHKIVSREVDQLFPKVKISGVVDRIDEDGNFKEKKPQIKFFSITSLENSDESKLLV